MRRYSHHHPLWVSLVVTNGPCSAIQLNVHCSEMHTLDPDGLADMGLFWRDLIDVAARADHAVSCRSSLDVSLLARQRSSAWTMHAYVHKKHARCSLDRTYSSLLLSLPSSHSLRVRSLILISVSLRRLAPYVCSGAASRSLPTEILRTLSVRAANSEVRLLATSSCRRVRLECMLHESFIHCGTVVLRAVERTKARTSKVAPQSSMWTAA